MIKSTITKITNRNLRSAFDLIEVKKDFKSSIRQIFSQESCSSTWIKSCVSAFNAISPYFDETPQVLDKSKADDVFCALNTLVREVNDSVSYYQKTNNDVMLSPLIYDTSQVLPENLLITHSSAHDIKQILKNYSEDIVTGDFDITNPDVEGVRQLLLLAFITKETLYGEFSVNSSMGDISIYFGDEYFASFDFGIDDPEDGTNIEFTIEGYGVEVEGEMHSDSDYDFFFKDTKTLQKKTELISQTHSEQDIELLLQATSKGGTSTEIFNSLYKATEHTSEKTPFIDSYLQAIKTATLTDLIETPDDSQRKNIIEIIKENKATNELMNSLLQSKFDSWIERSAHTSEYLINDMDSLINRIKRELSWGNKEILNTICEQLLSTQNYLAKNDDLGKALNLIVASKSIPFDRDSYEYWEEKIRSQSINKGKDYNLLLSGLSAKYLEVTVDKKLISAGKETKVINFNPTSF